MVLFVLCSIIIFFVFLYPGKSETAEEIQQSPQISSRNPYFERVLKLKYEVNKSMLFKEYGILIPTFYNSDYSAIHNIVYSIEDTRTVKKFERYVRKYWWGLGFQSGKVSIKHIEIEIYPTIVEKSSCNYTFGDALILALEGKSNCFRKTEKMSDTVLKELCVKYNIIFKERRK